MIISDINELKTFFKENNDKNQEDIIVTQKEQRSKSEIRLDDDKNLILKFDENGNYTSYPNEELKKAKFRIAKKYCNLEIPEHRHEYIEIVYVIEGKMQMTIDGKNISMKKNDICIMNNNVKHSNRALSNDDIVINILLTSKVFDTVFMYLLSDDNYISNFIINSFYSINKVKKYMLNNIKENSFLENVLINLICEYYSDSIRSEGKIKGCLLLLFTELSRLFGETKNINIDKKSSKLKSDIIEYLEKEYKDTNLLKTANYFHFHPNYLSNLVKKEFGINFKDLLIDIRMIESAKMLRTTDKKINVIMEEVGYLNESYFYRQFKNKYNVTPLEYRKQMTGNILNY